MRILNSCVAGLPIWLFLTPLAVFGNKKTEKYVLFWRLIFSRIGFALAKHSLSGIFITNLLRRGFITMQGAKNIAKILLFS